MDMHEDSHGSAANQRASKGPGKGLPRRSQIGILVGLLVIGGAAVYFRPAPPKVEAAPEANPVSADGKSITLTDRQWATVKIAPVETKVFQDAAETDGKIAVDDDLVTPVFSQFTGRVTRLIAHAGDVVKAGDPLVAMQAAELAQAQNDVVAATAAVKTARAQLVLAQTNEKRQHDLYLAQGAALKDWQQSQVDLATAQGGSNSALIALAAVHNRLRILGKTEAEIAAIETSPDLLKVEADTPVPSPIAGVVVQRQVGLGQNIVSAASGAQNPIFQIGDMSKVWMIANVREGDAPMLRVGDPVEVKVLAYPNKTFEGRLSYVAASIDPNTHRLLVRAEVDNASGELKPEMFGNFRIVTGADTSSPGVPNEAIIFEGSTAHVWVADPAKKSLEIRPVEIGHRRGGLTEVVSGLKAGEQIVTGGAVFIDRAVSGD